MNVSELRVLLESALEGKELIRIRMENIIAEGEPVDGWRTYKATGEQIITLGIDSVRPGAEVAVE